MSDREHIEEFLMRLCSEFGTTDTPITEEIEAEISSGEIRYQKRICRLVRRRGQKGVF